MSRRASMILVVRLCAHYIVFNRGKNGSDCTKSFHSISISRTYGEIGVAVYEMHWLCIELPRACAVLDDAQRVNPEVAMPKSPD